MKTILFPHDKKYKHVNKYAALAKKSRIVRNCEKKIAYQTEEEALDIVKNKPPHFLSLYAYFCPECEQYHLTKKKR
jgi:hypothetical protein